MHVFNVADLKDPDDVEGRSYREVNNSKVRTIPIGTLVELEDGVRLWVVHHGRDSDGSVLYELSPEKDDVIVERIGFRNRSWHGGYPEYCLRIINKELS